MQEEQRQESLLETLGIGRRTKVLLLGTFHFAYPNLDVFSSEEKVDMLSARRQAEIAEVVDRLVAFGPTKVAVEARLEDDANLNQEYRGYRAGAVELKVGERHQLGFRIADRMNLASLFPLDEWGRPYISEQELMDYARRKLGDAATGLSEMELWFSLHEAFMPEYGKHHTAYADQVLVKSTLRECLLLLNSDEYLSTSHGMYLSWRDSSPGDYTMPDYITSWWYGRNLRIFANLKRITESPDDRILVIYGAGHIPILKHLVACSPKHELVDLRDYLG